MRNIRTVRVDSHLTERPIANDTILFGRDGLTGRNIRHHQSAPRLCGSGAYRATPSRAGNRWSAARAIQAQVRRMHVMNVAVPAARAEARERRRAKARNQQQATLNAIAAQTCPICLEGDARTGCPGGVCTARFHSSCLDCAYRTGHGIKCPACRWVPPRPSMPVVGRGITAEDIEAMSPIRPRHREMRTISVHDVPRHFRWIFYREPRDRVELRSAQSVQEGGPIVWAAMRSVLVHRDANDGFFPGGEEIYRVD